MSGTFLNYTASKMIVPFEELAPTFVTIFEGLTNTSQDQDLHLLVVNEQLQVT